VAEGVTPRTFDAIEHHRQRTRRAEARADGLEQVRQRLERLLALTIRVAAGNDVDPVTLLQAIERMDDLAHQDELQQLTELLRGQAA
jgi:hypothetical protein